MWPIFLSNDATCIACIIGRVLLEPSTLFTPACYKHTHYYSIATVLQILEYLHASHDFGILCKMLSINNDITMHATGHEWH